MNKSMIAMLMLAGCMSPARFDSQYKEKFCAEWQECNPDFECDYPEVDYADCEFDSKAAKDCLKAEWMCDTSNSAYPVVVDPDVCLTVYTGCTLDTGTKQPTTTPTGTTTTTGTTSSTP